MLVSLADVLRCPVCRGRVTGDNDGDGVRCTRCARCYTCSEGVLSMLDNSLPGIAAKRSEAAARVEAAREAGVYEPDDRVDEVLPFVCRDLGWTSSVWLGGERSFELLLDRYVDPGEQVLEVHAATCWAAQHVLKRGSAYVGTDILDDRNIGLGRGEFYERLVGPFGRVQADAERLPFADGAFDVTFAASSLDGAPDLGATVVEMARVTRPGGLVATLNQPARSPVSGGVRAARASDAPEARAAHTVWGYVAAFVRAGLRVRRVQPATGEARTGVGRLVTGVPKVGATLSALGELTTPGEEARVTLFARKPAR